MPKLPRIVAVLLVPCLLTDPTTAHAFAVPSTPAPAPRFTEQAINASLFSNTRLGKPVALKTIALFLALLTYGQNTTARDDGATNDKSEATTERASMIQRLVKARIFGPTETLITPEPRVPRRIINYSIPRPVLPGPRMGALPDAPALSSPLPASVISKSVGIKRYATLIARNARRYGISPILESLVLQRESWGNKDAVSDAGAIGLMQIEPETAQEIAELLGLIKPGETIEDVLRDPERNIRIGSYYICLLSARYGGRFILTFAAYNGGMKMVDALVAAKGSFDAVTAEDIPKRESRNYVLWLRVKFEEAGGDLLLPVASVLLNGKPAPLMRPPAILSGAA